MIDASLYITICSAKNRLRVRLKRLREPRYLLGAIVGVAYLYFTFFARSRGARVSAARRAARGAPAIPPALAALVAAGPALAALALLIVTALIWIVPGTSALLEFSEPEVQFLFPAPITRRQLLVHRILRSQLGLLFASAVFGIVTPSVAGFTRLRVAVAMWILMTTSKIYFAGVTLARTKLASADTGARRVAWTPVAILLAGLVIVATSFGQAFSASPASTPLEIVTRISELAARGATRIVLWPFVAVVQPLFAAWPEPYLGAVALSALVLAVTTVWVLQSDQAFEEAARVTAERRGSEPGPKRAAYRVRSSGWSLPIAGRPEAAFAWKAAMQTMRIVDRRSLARFVSLVIGIAAMSMSFGRRSGLASVVGLFATIGTGVAVFFVPQILRIDMRQDLQHLEILKTWPVAPAAVVRGELIWPGAVITAIAWFMLAVALAMSGAVIPAAWSWRVSAAIGAALLVPALVFAQLTIHNGVALMFPAWVPTGGQRPRGLDAMGQRIIMLGATWLLTIVMVLPAAIAGAIVWFAFRSALGSAAMVPGAVVCALVIGLEVLMATEALGPAYERLDILAVERAE